MKYLGVDWGLKRVGLASSEGELAAPLYELQINSLKDGIYRVNDIIKQQNFELVIIGKPEGQMGKMVEEAALALQKLITIPLVLSDETLSTQTAKKSMMGMGFKKKARREDNAVAAAIILQRYLDEKI